MPKAQPYTYRRNRAGAGNAASVNVRNMSDGHETRVTVQDDPNSGTFNVNIEVGTRRVNGRLIAAVVGGTPNVAANTRPYARPNAASNRPNYPVPNTMPRVVAASNRPQFYAAPNARPINAANARPYYAAPNARPFIAATARQINAANARLANGGYARLSNLANTRPIHAANARAYYAANAIPHYVAPSARQRVLAFSGLGSVANAGPSSATAYSPVIDVDASPTPVIDLEDPVIDVDAWASNNSRSRPYNVGIEPSDVIDLCESDDPSMDIPPGEEAMELDNDTPDGEVIVINDDTDDEASSVDNEDASEIPDYDSDNNGRPSTSDDDDDDDGPYLSDGDDDDFPTFADERPPVVPPGPLFISPVASQVDPKAAPIAVEFPLSIESYMNMEFKDLPKGHVLLLLTGPPPANRVPGSARILRLALVRRLRRVTRFVSTRMKKSDQVDAINSSIRNSKILISPGHVDHMTKFIHLNGVSQKLKITTNSKTFASIENRVKSFQRCYKSLLPEVPTLCESGLYYKGNGDDDVMLCYCCRTYFMQWQYLVNPWVQHAIRSPECTLLLLYKGRDFVDQVHDTYNLIKTCSIWHYQELFYGLFSLFDLGLMDKTLGYGDDEGRALCIDQMVSVQVLRLCPESLPQSNLWLDRPPFPNDVTCKICYREKIEILFIPCGHLYSCTQCAVILHECAVCREPFGTTTYAMSVNMLEKERYQSETTTVSNGSEDNAMCRLCFKEPIGMAFVPCLHVLSCYQCAISVEECPVCEQPFFGLIQVFL